MKALKALHETRLLQTIADKGWDFAPIDSQSAADLAKAAHATLLAEEKLALAEVMEAEHRLSILKDAAELARAHVAEAQAQVGDVLSHLDKIRFNVAPPPVLTEDFSDLAIMQALPHHNVPTLLDRSFDQDEDFEDDDYLGDEDGDVDKESECSEGEEATDFDSGKAILT